MLSPQLKHIFYLLSIHSDQNYLVGGCVRDGFLGVESKDYDIVTDVPYDVAKDCLSGHGWEVKEAGEQFLVLHVSKEGEQYEIANFRKEGVYLDGRRPSKVEIGNIHDDAVRRDFTINALYENPRTGQILDPTGQGLSDIKSRTLRFIGKPKERIKEDYLRVFRFYRFLATKGLNADPKSMKACREYFTEAYLKTTPERARMEIERML
jgi:poly(A) polymerase